MNECSFNQDQDTDERVHGLESRLDVFSQKTCQDTKSPSQKDIDENENSYLPG